MPSIPKIVICGGGASAVLFLHALLRRTGRTFEVTVIEPRGTLGVGVAYSTDCAEHLLNTRAANMSVGPDAEDFLDWLRKAHPRRPINWTRHDFVPRRIYGEYLQAKVREIEAAPHIRLRWVRSSADAILDTPAGWEVVLARGASVHADIVILATGNERPRPVCTDLPPQAQHRVLNDPWDNAARAAIDPNEPILLVGSGLTAIDIIVERLQNGHKAAIHAVSPRGLLPRRHVATATARMDLAVQWLSSPRAVLHQLRALAGRHPEEPLWQGLVNELRFVAPTIWACWSDSERRRFLRHLSSYWNVHRHRVAPQIHARIRRAMDRKQLSILRGRIAGAEVGENGLRVRVAGRQAEKILNVSRIINCAGPETHPGHSQNPLLQSLLSDRLARADILGLGLDVDGHSRVIAADGSAHRTLYAMGSLTRGSRWEITSIAEIREQAQAMARHLTQFSATRANCAPHLTPLGNYANTAA